MSDAVSALDGVRFEGFATVAESSLVGMITLRGDLADATFQAAIGEIPGQGGVVSQGERTLLWMSPDELLLVLPYDQAPAEATRLAEALAGTHALVTNVSDARAMFRLEGKAAREVLAKLTPADLAPGAFAPGQVRRTRLAQVAAAFWMPSETSFHIICFRSVAEYVFGLLKTSAQKGSEVGLYSD